MKCDHILHNHSSWAHRRPKVSATDCKTLSKGRRPAQNDHTWNWLHCRIQERCGLLYIGNCREMKPWKSPVQEPGLYLPTWGSASFYSSELLLHDIFQKLPGPRTSPNSESVVVTAVEFEHVTGCVGGLGTEYSDLNSTLLLNGCVILRKDTFRSQRFCSLITQGWFYNMTVRHTVRNQTQKYLCVRHPKKSKSIALCSSSKNWAGIGILWWLSRKF